MKPLMLTMQAFGPFSATEIVDFSAFGDNALFLINGPTGAGKSTILDAICVALYGQTTGAERESAQMRCDHADPELATELTLEFELAEKRYRVQRKPQQERPKARGEGTTTQAAEANLWLHCTDDSANASTAWTLLVSKKVGEVNDAIRDITGLSVEQFRQVMVLPQGKFRELLLADSKSREAIFSQLFQTQIYRKIEDSLKIKASAIRRDAEAHRNKIKGILENAGVDSEQALNAERNALAPQLQEAEQKKKRAFDQQLGAQNALEAGKNLTERFQRYQQRKQELIQAEVQAEQIEGLKQQCLLAEQAEQINPIYTPVVEAERELNSLLLVREEAKHSLSQATTTYQQASTRYERAIENAKQVDELKNQQNELARLQTQVVNLGQARLRWSSAQQAAEASENTYLQAQQVLVDSKRQLSELEQLNVTAQQQLMRMPELQVRQTTLKQQRDHRVALDELRQQRAQAEMSGKQALLEKQTLQQESARLARDMAAIEMQWHSGQAALLAAQLGVGEPCPVCGSKEHPLPAHRAMTDDGSALVTHEQVEQARRRVNDQQGLLQQAENRYTELQQVWKGLNQQVLAVELQLAEFAEQSLVQLDEELAQLSADVDRLLQCQQQLAQRQRQIEALHQQLTGLESEQLKLQQQSADAQKAVAVAVAELRRLETEVPEHFRANGALEAEITRFEKQWQALELALQQATLARDQARSALDKAGEGDKRLQQQLDESRAKQQQRVQAWHSALSNSGFADENAFQQARLASDELQAIKLTIETYQLRFSELQGQVKQLAEELDGQATPQLEVLTQQLALCQQTYRETDQRASTLHARLTSLDHTLKNLQAAHLTNQALEAQYEIYGTLSDVANGQTGNKISLQRFVLSVLLDDVLIQASHRLQLMSKGRYLLLRKEDRSKGNRASGLELEVEDAYSGKTRSVATLSGGESFLAALALALGVSDVVQSYSGGIKLDTLFIDEGFGSLDPESLDLAVRTLVDLQHSGRMIGIISHVSELKEQMAMRLDVVATPKGSSVQLIA
ncbi:AAA family ATPase [Corallincola spongiicola]|uniref:SMC family ATPase n=1 Tax=Corallincola spongiicola TaxID=2520508 RepID=A0ABY1WSQ6_9GAMM|nr:SMC family ATPase [Corallincola spongiicola]TAA47770.1 SMC family ATPase [Corallincola spongiicola]